MTSKGVKNVADKLRIRGQYIGDLIWSPGSDFPWAKGKFSPGKDFEQFLRFFERIETLNGNVVNRLNFVELENAGYRSSDFTIGECDDVSYLVGLDYYDDGTAYWRFSMSPFDEHS